jgi:hypothetical protein
VTVLDKSKVWGSEEIKRWEMEYFTL